MDGGGFLFHLPISGHRNNLCPRLAPIQADLQQFTNAAPIGQSYGCQSGSIQAPSVQAGRLKKQFIWMRFELVKPAASPHIWSEQARSTEMKAIWDKERQGLAFSDLCLLTFRLPGEPTEQPFLDDLSEPQTIGSRTIKLQKKVSPAWIRCICLHLLSCSPTGILAKTIGMVSYPGTAIPQKKAHRHWSEIDLHICDALCFLVDFRKMIFVGEGIR